MLFDEAKALVGRALEAHIKLNGKGSMDEAFQSLTIKVGTSERNDGMPENHRPMFRSKPHPK